MSINDKLNLMLEYNSADLMNKSGGMARTAIKLFKIPFNVGYKLTKGAIKLVSASARAAKSTLDKIEDMNFKKSLGIKDLKELDIQLSKLSIESDEFGFLLFTILDRITKSKNKEFQTALNEIYEKHLERQVFMVIDKLNKTEDYKEANKIYGSLMSMIDLVWNKKSEIINDILKASIRYLDIDKNKKYTASKEIDVVIKKSIEKMTTDELNQALNYFSDKIAKLSENAVKPNMTINQDVMEEIINLDRKVKFIQNRLHRKKA
jgi:hypothetical protein